MKRFTAIVIICIFLFIPVFMNTASAESTLSISGVDIDAFINADGTVDVTEVWTVEYIGAENEFTRKIDFYDSKNTNEMTLLQKYDEITDVSVLIDGVTAPEGTGINSFIFQKSTDGMCYEFIINSPSAQTVKEFTINYTVAGAMKKKSGDANFSFVFLGNSFESTCNNVTVTVYPPEGTDESHLELPDDSIGTVTDNAAVFFVKRVSETFAVELSVNDSIFDDGALASYSAAAQNFKQFGNTVKAILPWIAAVAAAAAIILFVLFTDKLIRLPLNKNAAKLAEASSAEITRLPDGITSCEAYKMLVPYSRLRPKTTSKKIPLLFALSVLECIEKGYIKPEKDVFIVGTPSDAPDYIMSTLNFIKTFSIKKNNKFIIDSTFGEKLRAECLSRYDTIASYLITFYSLIPSYKGRFFGKAENKDMYENACALKLQIMKKKPKTNYYDSFIGVLQGKKTSDAEIFALMFSHSAGKALKSGNNDVISSISDAVYEMYRAFTKSK